MFLKNAFCMVGTSPDRRTNTLIREKKKAAIRMKRIPFIRPEPADGDSLPSFEF